MKTPMLIRTSSRRPALARAILALCAIAGTVSRLCVDAQAQVSQGSQGAAGLTSIGAGKQDSAPPLSSTEIASLKEQYKTWSSERRAEWKAYYADLGIDLDALLGVTAERAREEARVHDLVSRLREPEFFGWSNFAILSAQTRLNAHEPYPDARTAPAQMLSTWIRDRVLASAWSELGDFLAHAPGEMAAEVYVALLEAALPNGGANLLPAQVLAIADAAPLPLTDDLIRALAVILRASTSKHATDELMAALEAGTTCFGNRNEIERRKTVDLLFGAGLVREAFAFLPPVSDAGLPEDAQALLVRGQYEQYLADHLRESEETELRRAEAWDHLGRAAANRRATFEVKDAAMQSAIGLMYRLPRARVEPWLAEISADDELVSRAIEKIALEAVALANAAVERSDRARAIVALKEAVDVLINSRPSGLGSLRVPLRMLATTIAAEMEEALTRRNEYEPAWIYRAALLRAAPDANWLDALEPSVSVRVSGASLELAISTGDVDRALEMLRDAVRRVPKHARDLAERFLRQWTSRLEFGGHEHTSPITRGYQKRNIAALKGVIQTLAGAGADPATLPGIALAFRVCHNDAEVYERQDIVDVFGTVEALPATTARELALQIGRAVDGYWRDRLTQRRAPAAPTGKSVPQQLTNAEIVQVVDEGFETALALGEQARTVDPDSWETARLIAVLQYQRLTFSTKVGRTEEARRLECLRDAYAAFAKAADTYRSALAAGSEREDASLFYDWFKAAMGAQSIEYLRFEDLPTEGSLQQNQFARLGEALRSLPHDVASRHISEFSADVMDALDTVPFEIKPRFVAAAVQVVGDDPAGKGLQARDRLFHELMSDEVRLRLTVDGPDEVQLNAPFAVVLSLRCTNAVDRASGGFSRYLQNGAPFYGAGGYERTIDYKDLLRKNIETAFAKNFAVASIGFYEPNFPPWAVVEGGQSGWVEKPFAYVLLSAKDVSVDRIPRVSMEMQFPDGNGYVNVVTTSNTPPIAVRERSEPRPVDELQITQMLDARDALAETDESHVRLEIKARGRGSVPDLPALLAGIEGALPGYSLAADGIVAKPTLVFTDSNAGSVLSPGAAGTTAYPEPNESGIVRPLVERNWVVTYLPSETHRPARFVLPALLPNVHATLQSKRYGELELGPVAGSEVELFADHSKATVVLVLAGAVAVALAVALVVRRRRARRPLHVEHPVARPARITPLSVSTALRRLATRIPEHLHESRRLALAEEIARLELGCFGPGSGLTTEELSAVLDRWTDVLGTSHAAPHADAS